MRYLIDTDWVIHYLNADRKIVANLDARRADGIGISMISVAELFEGALYARDTAASERKLHDFLAGLTKLAIDEERAESSVENAVVSAHREKWSAIST